MLSTPPFPALFEMQPTDAGGQLAAGDGAAGGENAAAGDDAPAGDDADVDGSVHSESFLHKQSNKLSELVAAVLTTISHDELTTILSKCCPTLFTLVQQLVMLPSGRY